MSKYLNLFSIDLSKLPKYAELNKTVYQTIDITLANLILSSDNDLIKESSRNEFKKLVDRVDKRTSLLKVKYAPRYGVGRRYSSIFSETFEGLGNVDFYNYYGSLVNQMRLIKDTIFKHNNWVDIDQVKGHPTILYELALKNKIKLDSYKHYLESDNFNNVYLPQLIEFYSKDKTKPLKKQHVKQLFNKTIYGGGFKKWVESVQSGGVDEFNTIAQDKIELKNTSSMHPLYKAFFEDTQKMIKLIYSNNSEIEKLVCEDLDKKDTFSRQNRVMSYFCGIIENDITYHAYKYLINNKLIGAEFDWGFDGLTFPKFDNLDEHLILLNNYIRDKTNFKQVKFIIKPFEKTLDDLIEIRNKTEELTPSDLINNFFKPIEYLTKDYNKIDCCEPYVSDCLGYYDFSISKTIVIKSCTGTGKTTAISKYMKKYSDENQEVLFLSIVDKRTLAAQHSLNFENINIQNYQKTTIFENINLVICINSLKKINHNTNFKNTVVYIDEITSFLKGLTQNETLNHLLKSVYVFLKHIIKTCKKVVVSDAIISDSVFEFLNCRPDPPLFINNNYCKFEGVSAIHHQDENNFFEQLQNNIKDKKYFLFPCDSCETITQYYSKCIELFPEQKEDFILITSKTNYEITDANIQFKNKYVFYSPSIIYGVDFNSINEAQDVFLYSKANTLKPDSLYQQVTRTRNIKTLYFYMVDKKQQRRFKDIDDCHAHFTRINNLTDEALINMCSIIDEHDEQKVYKNSFFNLYCYNEFIQDQYNEFFQDHFYYILEQNKFIISSIGKPEKLNMNDKEDMKQLVIDCEEFLFQKFINAENRTDKEFSIINNNIAFLGLDNQENEVYEKYKNVIINSHNLKIHNSIIRILKDDIYIQDKLLSVIDNTFNIKVSSSPYYKIKLIRDLEAVQNIEPLDIHIYDTMNDIPIDLFNNICNTFNFKKAKMPTEYKELLKNVYIPMIRNVVGTTDIINRFRTDKIIDGERVQDCTYSLNIDVIKENVELNKFINPNLNNYMAHILEMIDEEPAKTPSLLSAISNVL